MLCAPARSLIPPVLTIESEPRLTPAFARTDRAVIPPTACAYCLGHATKARRTRRGMADVLSSRACPTVRQLPRPVFNVCTISCNFCVSQAIRRAAIAVRMFACLFFRHASGSATARLQAQEWGPW